MVVGAMLEVRFPHRVLRHPHLLSRPQCVKPLSYHVLNIGTWSASDVCCSTDTPEAQVKIMSKKKLWIPGIMTAAALVLWAFVRGGGETAGAYRFVSVERGTVESLVTSTGTLQATEMVEVGTQVSGQVSGIFADFNDRVEKGQLLARIDPMILQQEVRAAEANVLRNRAEVEQATRGLERNRELHGQKVLTDAELEQSEYQATVAQAALSSAEVSLERAKRNLAYTEIRAPIDGVVVERSVDVGQTVAASMSAPVLFLIAQDLAEMEILASVDESDIGRIEQGQETRFTVQAYGTTPFSPGWIPSGTSTSSR